MSVLDEICERKKGHVAAQKAAVPFEALKTQIENAPAPRGFIKTLETCPAPAIIAEVKKASPSKGILRKNFDPAQIAAVYEQNGAACISVLTDEPFFQGSDTYLHQIRKITAIPLLRKDFMIDSYQIYESRALGADCILLIMAALSDESAQELYELAGELNMDVLVEVHDSQELERALRLSPAMIGVNNRNLKTLDVDVKTSFELVKLIPNHVLKVAESGIPDRNTMDRLMEAGYRGFLIGEALMRETNIGGALAKLAKNN